MENKRVAAKGWDEKWILMFNMYRISGLTIIIVIVGIVWVCNVWLFSCLYVGAECEWRVCGGQRTAFEC